MMSEGKNDDEEMKEEIDTVKGLLGKLQHDRVLKISVVNSTTDKSTRSWKGSHSDVDNHNKGAQDEVISEIHEKATSLLINLKSPGNEQRGKGVEMMDDTPEHSEDTDGQTRQTPHKRKQDRFLAELHEKAEVISKSARTSAEGVIVKIDLAPNLEDDPEAGEFLRKIRSSETGQSMPTEMEVEEKHDDTIVSVDEGVENIEGKVQLRHPRPFIRENAEEFQRRRHTTTAVVDFSNLPSDFTIDLNLDPQKSRISLVKQGALKDRRKPTAANRRSRPTSLVMFDEMATDEEMEKQDRNEQTISSGLKPSPSTEDGKGLKPRVSPKPKMKSKTVAGISLPGLAEAIQFRQQKKIELPKKMTAADVVKGAKIEKENRAVKEEKIEKTPQKPAWLLEAEARRKHHDRRRSQKTKEMETSSTITSMSPISVALSSSSGTSVLSCRVQSKPTEKLKTTSSVPLFGKETLGDNNTPSEQFETKTVSTESVRNYSTEPASSFKSPKRIHAILSPNRNIASKQVENTALSGTNLINRLKPIANTGSDEEVVLKAMVEKKGENGKWVLPTSYKLVDIRVEESRSLTPTSPKSPPFSSSLSHVGSPSCDFSSPTKVTVNGSTIQQAEVPTKLSSVKPTPKPKPKGIVASKSDISPSKYEVKHQVNTTSNELTPSVSTRFAHEARKERVHTHSFGEYKPSFTGNVLPQWKKDLLQKKKHVKESSHENQVEPEHQFVEVKIIPKWKRDLMERKKDGHKDRPVEPSSDSKVDSNGGEPSWMKELQERKKRGGSAPGKVATEGDNVSEIRRRMSGLRHRPVAVVQPNTEDVDAKPSFMKEFEKKKRVQPRPPVMPRGQFTKQRSIDKALEKWRKRIERQSNTE